MVPVHERVRQTRLRVFGLRGGRQCARILGIHYTSLMAYESGKRVMPLEFVDKFSTLTGCPLLWLVRGQPDNFTVDELPVFEGEVTLSFDQMIARANSPTEYVEAEDVGH